MRLLTTSYRTVDRVAGPLLFLRATRRVGLGELAAIRLPDGRERLGEVLEVRDEVLYPKDLDTADEMFITSTTRELSPVVQVDDRVVGSGRPGPVTEKLLAGYRRKAQDLTTGVTTSRA